MPPQIKRLALLFVIFIGLFFVARYFLVPESFGEFGHYRGLSLVENQAKLPKYAGQLACADCHENETNLKAQNEHKSVSCESCHGAGMDHINSTDSIIHMQVPKSREFCAACHAENAARKTDNIIQIDVAKHNPEGLCFECHNPHSPWQNLK